MSDKLKPMTPGWHKRQRVHRHNGYKGSARMMQMQATAIFQSDSTDKKTKQLANKIHDLAKDLGRALDTRIDP